MSEKTLLDSDKKADLPDATKQVIEYAKHLTNVSSATLLVLVTFLQKVIAQVKWSGLLPIVLVCLGVAIVSATFAQGYTVERALNGGRRRESAIARSLGFAQAGFAVGMITLVIFAIKNLFA